jgi:hypothetical protein
MAAELRHLTIDFLEDRADALRKVTQPNWQLECLICSRSALPGSLGNVESRKALDVPGVYLLVGPPEKSDDNLLRDWRLYVGQADSVADRLDIQLKDHAKTWCRTVVVIRRPDNSPLNLSQCQFLESKLHALALQARTSVLINKNAPRCPSLSATERSDTQDLLNKAIVIVGALGLNLFDPSTPPKPPPNGPAGEVEPPVPANLRQLLEELRKAISGPSFPKAEWYGTRVPDYRAKVVSGGDFRVFYRITWAKNWFHVELKDVEKFKISNFAELEKHRENIRTAYDKADKYLQRGK